MTKTWVIEPAVLGKVMTVTENWVVPSEALLSVKQELKLKKDPQIMNQINVDRSNPIQEIFLEPDDFFTQSHAMFQGFNQSLLFLFYSSSKCIQTPTTTAPVHFSINMQSYAST